MEKALGSLNNGSENQLCISLNDLFSDFSTGLLDNGPALPDRLTGCKVPYKVSEDRCKDPIVVGPDTLAYSKSPGL